MTIIGIPPAPKKVGTKYQCFEVDANGIINATAQDTGPVNKSKITVTNDGRVSEARIEKMIDRLEKSN